MNLYHYYETGKKPFMNISELSKEEAEKVMLDIKSNKPNSQCASRHPEYVKDRLNYENIVRDVFIKKGGRCERLCPHYMVVEHSPWLSGWFEKTSFIKIPIEEFDINTLSFTYGDSHPTFSPRITDGKEYRKQLYMYNEILNIIDKYELPQNWNDDGRFGPERYIEVQIWSDETIEKYR